MCEPHGRMARQANLRTISSKEEGRWRSRKTCEENKWMPCPKCSELSERRLRECSFMRCRCGTAFFTIAVLNIWARLVLAMSLTAALDFAVVYGERKTIPNREVVFSDTLLKCKRTWKSARIQETWNRNRDSGEIYCCPFCKQSLRTMSADAVKTRKSDIEGCAREPYKRTMNTVDCGFYHQ